jgi:hypothetical protein
MRSCPEIITSRFEILIDGGDSVWDAMEHKSSGTCKLTCGILT